MAGTDVFLGLDLGSRTTKLVEMAGGAVRRSEVFDTSPDTLDRVRARLAARGYIRAAATGYGRFLVNAHLDCRVVTEITACAQGARFLRPAAGLVIDVGGQDSKVILLGGGPGPFADFEMNDRCAAGTGRFLEVMAARLGLPLGEFGREAGPDDGGPLALSSMCTVFAESEVVSLLAAGRDRRSIALDRRPHLSARGPLRRGRGDRAGRRRRPQPGLRRGARGQAGAGRRRPG